MESKYMQVYNTIVSRIEEKIYPVGGKLPAEKDLIEEFQVSRDTVRRALTKLDQNGYIKKSQGRAATVLDIQRFNFPVSEIASFKELHQLSGIESETLVENLEIIAGNKKIMEKLSLSEKEEAYRLLRIRKIDNERVIIDKDYFKRKVVPNLPLKVVKDSVYEYLEKELKLEIGFAVKEITVQEATKEDYELLDMKNYDMVAVVKSYTYLDNATLFQYTESRHRPDKFRFVDFAKRKL